MTQGSIAGITHINKTTDTNVLLDKKKEPVIIRHYITYKVGLTMFVL